MAVNFEIDAMRMQDWPQVRRIYADGLATRLAAFMLTPPVWKAWDAGQLPIGRLVARSNQEILGWAALKSVADT